MGPRSSRRSRSSRLVRPAFGGLTGLALALTLVSSPVAAERSEDPASRGAVADAVAEVRTAVAAGRRGARLPRHPVPSLGKALNRDRASLAGCDYGDHRDDGGKLCRRGDTHGDRTLVLLGDSHGRHWIPALEGYAKRHGWRAYYLVKESCTASRVVTAEAHSTRANPAPWTACQAFRDWTLEAIARLDPDVVAVSTSIPAGDVISRHGYAETAQQKLRPFREGFLALFARIRKVSDARIVFVRDVPSRQPGTAPEFCWRKKGASQRPCLSRQRAKAVRYRLVDASQAAARQAGVDIADPTRFFCSEGLCPVVMPDGVLTYRNASHITATYARQLAEPFGALLGLDDDSDQDRGGPGTS